MMLYSRLAAVLCLGVSVLAVAACSDNPGSVGAGIGPGGSSDGAPQDTSVVVSSTDTRTTPSETGFASTNGPWRFLTGTVTDPLAGRLETTGALDLDGTVERTGSIADTSTNALDAKLQLTRSYIHGDTTTALTLELVELSREADMERAPADTTFPAESTVITTTSISPTTSTVTFSLPQSWISEHANDLQDDSEDPSFSDFHGFQLQTTSGQAVVGFEHDSATLQLTTSQDTVAFPASQSFTQIERTAPPSASLPDDRRLLLDGIGTALTFNWADNNPLDSLAQTNDRLNRADLIIPVETDPSFASTASNFVRPSPSGYRIRARQRDDSPNCRELGFFSRSIDGTDGCGLPTSLDQTSTKARLTRNAASNLIERWFETGTQPFPSFHLEIANRADASASSRATTTRGLPSTIPVTIPIPTASSSTPLENLPRVTLTRTPL